MIFKCLGHLVKFKLCGRLGKISWTCDVGKIIWAFIEAQISLADS